MYIAIKTFQEIETKKTFSYGDTIDSEIIKAKKDKLLSLGLIEKIEKLETVAEESEESEGSEETPAPGKKRGRKTGS